jgi:hypothetical protein
MKRNGHITDFNVWTVRMLSFEPHVIATNTRPLEIAFVH